MASSEDEQTRVRNNNRRQAYYRRRRTVQRIEREGVALQTESMNVFALTATLEQSLYHLMIELAGGSSPEHYTMARTAWECYGEIIGRGEALRLID